MRRSLIAALALVSSASPAVATIAGENGPIAFERTFSGSLGGVPQVWLFDRSSPTLESALLPRSTAAPAWCVDRVLAAFVSSGTVFHSRVESDPAGFVTEPGRIDGLPTCAPDGQAIAYSGTASATLGPDVYRLAAGGVPQRLTADPGTDESPDWSPDGGRIAFASNRGGDFEIVVMAADGNDPRPITANAVDDAMPSWSPDGSRIAFTSQRAPAGIWTMAADGSDARFVGAGSEPAWSPDGTRIAFSNAAEGDSVWVMNADGTGRQAFTSGSSTVGVESDGHPAWRPIRPVPVIGAFAASTPGSAAAGSGAHRLRVTGSRFIIGSLVTVNGADRPTTYLGPSELAADLPASDLAGPGALRIGVRTPPPAGGVSAGALTFSVLPTGAVAGRLALGKGTTRGRWAVSRLVGGRLTVAGETSRAARLRIAVRRGSATVATATLDTIGGPFRTTIALPPGVRPGRLAVTVSEPNPPAGASVLAPTTLTTRLAAPPEGVAARAWISRSAGGAVRARLRVPPRVLVANFRMVALPAKGKRLAVVWRLGGFHRAVSAPRPEGRLVTSIFGSFRGGTVGAGVWSATLTAGGKPVAVATVRVG